MNKVHARGTGNTAAEHNYVKFAKKIMYVNMLWYMVILSVVYECDGVGDGYDNDDSDNSSYYD